MNKTAAGLKLCASSSPALDGKFTQVSGSKELSGELSAELCSELSYTSASATRNSPLGNPSVPFPVLAVAIG